MKKLLSVFVLMSMLFLCCCGKKAGETSANKNLLQIVKEDGTTEYSIVRGDSSSEAETNAALSLRKAIQEKTGLDIKIATDFEKKGTDFKRSEFEILVGKTNRDESAHAIQNLTKSKDFAIVQVGTKIAINAVNEDAIQTAVDYFIANYISSERKKIEVPLGETFKYIGEYEVEDITVAGKSIADYAIVYGSGKEDYKKEALALRDTIDQKSGFKLPISGTLSNKYSNIISVGDTKDPTADEFLKSLGDLEYGYRVYENEVAIAAGKFSAINEAAAKFTEELFASDQKKPNIAVGSAFIGERSDNAIILVDESQSNNYLSVLDAKAKSMIEKITATASVYPDTGTKYYVSGSGDDNNDGLSPEKAWKTINKVNSTASIKAGDSVLFERGSEFRGQLKAEGGVTYSAYGTGVKPVINASAKNYADQSLWKQTGIKNVYVCTETLDNVGMIAFNHSPEYGVYDELMGTMKIKGVKDFNGEKDLSEDLQFYSNLDTKELFLYSDKGNPGKRFSSIEIGTNVHAISVTGDNVTIDNLWVKHCGAHGVGIGTRKKTTVQNCVFSYLGGSILKGYNGANVTRYGNAVQVYGGCDGYYVKNNWMYQIYDTGVTHQYSGNTTGDNHMNDVVYLDNLIEYCYWSIEFYNYPVKNTKRSVKNVYMKNNFCRFGGYGWGCVGRETSAPMFSGGAMTDDVENCVAEENIFDRCLGRLIFLSNNEGNKKFILRNNTYVQPYGAVLGDIFGKRYLFDENGESVLRSLVGEQKPVMVYIMNKNNTQK